MSVDNGNRSPAPLEMWAGLECTINRVGDCYRDQLQLSGHYERESDIDCLIALNVRSVRYPVLWERHAHDSSAWRTTDRALARLREANIEPVIGLMHHGSGIDGASLLDAAYPQQLAAFAHVVAKRYPWVTRFTPVNEPLTTARFAALYGLWYPHHASDASFTSALLNQLLAIQHSMRAIRSVTPHAQLIATEDLGYTHAATRLGYQAHFENERRWLTWDLLSGRMHELHPMWKYLMQHGNGDTLRSITQTASEDAHEPLLIGVNHYLTSERYLDTDIDRYPRASHGGNGSEAYADVEAVRVLPEGPLGVQALLMQVWQRYKLPLAVTEAHLGCTREQQMQWLAEVWQSALRARECGADVRAVTAWSAFGSFDWNSLLTRDERVYETGLFDLRAPEPRATALATMVTALSADQTFDHPALHATPWWRDHKRLHHAHIAPVQREGSAGRSEVAPNVLGSVTSHRSRFTGRPLLVTGACGTLGHAFVRIAGDRGLLRHGLLCSEMDLTDPVQIEHRLRELNPWAVVNAAGWVRVDDAERDPNACVRTNTDVADALAIACSARDVQLVTFSSDLVFGGDRDKPFVESDTPQPLSVYGRSRNEGERRVRLSAPQSLVVRSGATFGDWDDFNFLSRSLATLSNGRSVRAPSDSVVSLTYVTDLVNTVLDLLLDAERGTWHLANSGALTWTDLARIAADMAGLDAQKIVPCAGSEIGWIAQRPRYSALTSERASMLPDFEHALSRWIGSRAWERVAARAIGREKAG